MSRGLILVVDDQFPQLEKLKSLVQEEQFDVKSASTKEEALEYINSEEALPDVAILDVRLSSDDDDIGGIEIAEELLNIKDVPIIFVTGRREQYLEKMYRVGAYSIFEKPIDPFKNRSKFADAIELALNQNRKKLGKDSDFVEQFDSNNKIVVKTGTNTEYAVLDINDILYVLSSGHLVQIHTTHGERYDLSTTKGNFERQVKAIYNKYDEHFMNKRKGFIININHIKKFDESKIWFKSQDKFLAYNNFKKDIKDFFGLLNTKRKKS